jgi:hypothetical protein
VLWIRIGFNADPDPAFSLNADPDQGSHSNAVPDSTVQKAFTKSKKQVYLLICQFHAP